MFCANNIKKYIFRSLSHIFSVLEYRYYSKGSCLFLEENLVPFVIEKENPDKEQIISLDPDDLVKMIQVLIRISTGGIYLIHL